MKNELLAPALEAKKHLSEHMRKSGFRAAVGVAKGGGGSYALKVSFQEAAAPLLEIPSIFEGFPVLVEVTGKVSAHSVIGQSK